MPPLAPPWEGDASASKSEIPYKNVDKKAEKAEPVEDEDDEDEEDEEDEGDEEDEEDEGDEEDEEDEDAEVYEVEKITSHTSDDQDRDIKYEVVWVGYPSFSDRTWEPKANLLDSKTGRPIDKLKEYWANECNGKEPKYVTKKQREKEAREKEQAAKASTAGARKRKLSQSTPNTPTQNETKGRRKSGRSLSSSATPQKEDVPVEPIKKQIDLPSGSWEKLIARIHTIEEQRNEKTGEKERFAFVEWEDIKRCQSKHALQLLRVKCPQRLLDYYEQHLVFHTPHQTSTEQNGDGDIRGELDSDVFMDL